MTFSILHTCNLTYDISPHFVFSYPLLIQFVWPCGISGLYSCPVYYFPQRGGTIMQGRSGFIVTLELKSGLRVTPEHWVRRAVAALLSVDY